MEIRFVLGRIGEKSELGNTKDFSVNIFDVGLPHLARLVYIGKDANSQATSIIRGILVGR